MSKVAISTRGRRKAYDHLYVAQCETGHIKIGRSADVEQRIRYLQEAMPFAVELVHFAAGAGGEEARILTALSPFWFRGEWHVGTRACKDAVAALIGVRLVWPYRSTDLWQPRVPIVRASAAEDELDRALDTGRLTEPFIKRRRRARLIAEREKFDPTLRPRHSKLVKGHWYWDPPDRLRRLRGLKTVALGADQAAAWAYARTLNRDHL